MAPEDRDNTVVEDVLDAIEPEPESGEDVDVGTEPAATKEADAESTDTTAETPESIYKEKNRLRRENRRLRQSLAQRVSEQDIVPTETVPAATPVTSPLDTFFAENADDPDAPIPGSVMRAQREYEKAENRHQATVAVQQTKRQALVRSLAVTKAKYTVDDVGEGLDFETVVAAGSDYLDADDKDAIRNAGKRGGQLLYDICLQYAGEAETDAGDMVRAALTRPVAGTVKPGARTSPSPAQTKTPQKSVEPPTREAVLASGARTSGLRPHQRLGIQFPDEMPPPSGAG